MFERRSGSAGNTAKGKDTLGVFQWWPMLGGWNEGVFKDPSYPKHSMVL